MPNMIEEILVLRKTMPNVCAHLQELNNMIGFLQAGLNEGAVPVETTISLLDVVASQLIALSGEVDSNLNGEGTVS